jgi:hypothetical protein
MRLIISFLLIFLVCGCKNEKNHNDIVIAFLQNIKLEEYSKAKSMLWEDGRDNEWYNNTNFDRIHDLMLRYKLPDEKDWIVEYDTLHIVKHKSITLPIYNGYDHSNRLKEASITIDFEHKGEHAGNLILGFQAFTVYDR